MPVASDVTTLPAEPGERASLLRAEALAAWRRRVDQLGTEIVRALVPTVMLRCLDTDWPKHLQELDRLVPGPGQAPSAGVDPLVAYRISAAQALKAMRERSQDRMIRGLFTIEVPVETDTHDDTSP
jgi:preprotein translocase subunit SecA